MPDDTTMTELHEAARECPVLKACLQMQEAGHWNFEQAMTQAALTLARENKRLFDLAVQQAVLRPPAQLIVPKAP